MKKSGIPIVISAPSGAGKSTLAAQVVRLIPSAALSISCTTRAPRAGEVDGKDYFFATQDEFKRKIEQGDFLEWAVVHGHHYGTPRSALEKQLSNNIDVILTIDPQGALSVKRIFPNGVYIFIIPPSWDVLVNRLKNRATDDPASVERRIANARKELSYLSHYDYVIVNDALEAAVASLKSIIEAEHLKLSRLSLNDIPLLKS